MSPRNESGVWLPMLVVLVAAEGYVSLGFALITYFVVCYGFDIWQAFKK